MLLATSPLLSAVSASSLFVPSQRLSTISYRSRATSRLSELDLEMMVKSAQIRNRAESITGMMIYEDGKFLQWLEGPSDSLSRVIDSISRDARHTDIEVLGNQPALVRMFNGWDLKFGRKQSQVGIGNATDRGPISKPGGTKPERFSPVRSKDLEPGTLELAQHLISDVVRATELIDRAASQIEKPTLLFRDLFEPAARALGDLWTDDLCSEFDVTIGLCHLQTAMRRKNCNAFRPLNASRPRVLVVPQPGEPHMLAAVLNSEVLWQAGWSVCCEFPASDQALQDILAEERFDALDLSLSTAFARKHWMPRIALTSARARASSQNPSLVVVASGRLFTEKENHALAAGVDASIPSSHDIEEVISQALAQRGRHGAFLSS